MGGIRHKVNVVVDASESKKDGGGRKKEKEKSKWREKLTTNSQLSE